MDVRQGRVASVGMEGTDAYGVGLARYLHHCPVTVLEVPHPDRLRRQRGKSNPINAGACARAVLAGHAGSAPKLAAGFG